MENGHEASGGLAGWVDAFDPRALAARCVELDAEASAVATAIPDAALAGPFRRRLMALAAAQGIPFIDRRDRSAIPMAGGSSWTPERPCAHLFDPGEGEAWLGAAADTLIGGAWWPGMSEWDLQQVARLTLVTRALILHWLGSIGQEFCPLHSPRTALATRLDCGACARLAVRHRSPALRVDAINTGAGAVLENVKAVLAYEVMAFRAGLRAREVWLPEGSWLPVGDACAMALNASRRLAHPALQRWRKRDLHWGILAESSKRFEDRIVARMNGLTRSIGPDYRPGAFAARRGRRVLADLGLRLSWAMERRHLPDAIGASALDDLGSSAKALSEGGEAPDVIEAALSTLAEHLRDHPETTDIWPIGAPLNPGGREPGIARATRGAELNRRLRAEHHLFTSTAAASPALVAAALDTPVGVAMERRFEMAAEHLTAHAVQAPLATAPAREYMIDAWVGWLAAVSRSVRPVPQNAAPGWYYLMARDAWPNADAYDAIRVVPNPYLSPQSAPFERQWTEAMLRANTDGPIPAASPNSASLAPRPTTMAWNVFVGPGRDGTPRVLPEVGWRRRILALARRGATLAKALTESPEDALRRAVSEDLVLLINMTPPVDRLDATDATDSTAEANV